MDDEHQGSALIVEDEAELRFILTAHLRATGFTVMEASNGVDAIELATERRPDIIIMDIGLPGMDGIAATRTLKADSRTAHIPIIMLTARSGTGDVVRGLEAGAQEYLPKPFELAELLARVRSVHRLTLARRDLDRLNTRLEAEVDHKTKTLRRLYEFMRDLNHADSRDRILDLLIRCVEHTTGAQRISLFLMDATGEYLVCERALGIDRSLLDRIPIAEIKGVTEQVVRTGTTLAAKIYGVTSPPARGYRQDMFLSTPLLDTSLETRDSVIGVLNVTDKTDDSPFCEEEIDCIRSITDATAIALDRFNRRIRLQQSVRVLLHTLGHMAEFRDPETTLHLERVTRMARILAEAVAREGPYVPLVTTEFIEILVQAAPMHDIGKVGIADDILIKPGSLTDEEFQIMKTHTDIGQRVLSRALDPSCPVPLLTMCIDIAHCHHERFDGSGYPRRLIGQDIPLAARIIALVDAYDAITSRRRYKEPKPHCDAVEIIRAESGKHFDPAMVDAFLQCHEQFQKVHEECADTLGTPSGSNRTECIVTAG
jgi:response regulator RpfG family c-di-GMP phosphodiesterase